MKLSQRLTGLTSAVFRSLRTACGLALVLTAFGGAAQAGGPQVAPEIDPGSMTSALMLLGGGVMLLADRFRKR